MITPTTRDLLAIGFLATLIVVSFWQLISGMRKGVIYVPGRRGIFRVVHAYEPLSFWGVCAFYCFILMCLHVATWSVIKEVIWPGPSEPARLTTVAFDESTVEVSWLPPPRRDAPPDYGVYRSTEPGVEPADYELVAIVTWQPYRDRSVEPATSIAWQPTILDSRPP